MKGSIKQQIGFRDGQLNISPCLECTIKWSVAALVYRMINHPYSIQLGNKMSLLVFEHVIGICG